jgi:prepilin peptidase CpaA
MTPASIIATLGVALIACATDIKSRRIPNVLTFSAAVAAIAYHTALGGWTGFQSATLGWLAGAAAFMPFFLLGGMGGGDVKLLAALGAWMGPAGAFIVALYASLAGGVLAVVVAFSSGYLRTALTNVRTLLTFWALVGPKPMASLTLERSQGPRLAYAIPICIGTMVTLWLR